MNDLHQRFREILQGRVCVVGVGNVELGDDGVGVRLAEALAKSENRNPALWRNADSFGVAVVVAGAEPERHVSRITEGLFDNVIFLDAVEFGGAPGAVVLLNAEEMAARFPQVTTHRLSLGLLAGMIEASGSTKVWLLGVQPESLREGGSLSPKVQASVKLLASLVGGLSDEWRASVLECGGPPPLCRGHDGEFVLPGAVVARPEGARRLAHSKTLRAAKDRNPSHSTLSTRQPALPC